MYTANNTNASIEIFIINKNSALYKNIINNLINNIKNVLAIDMSDTEDKKIYLPFKYIKNWYAKNNYQDLLNIIIYLKKDNVMLLIFENKSINKEKTTKEFYSIINSLTREKII